MIDISFYISRFFRKFHYFVLVASAISATAITVAMTLPPAYESELRLLVESKQIPDQLAQSTVSTPALELLQIIEQRLLTRENLLGIANDLGVLRDQSSMSPDEIVRAMRARTQIRNSAGREQATVMRITFEAPRAVAAAGVLNAYLTLILEEDAQFRTGRALTTLEFFQQQVDQLGQQLDEKSAQILEFKNSNSDALPETLEFRMGERSNLIERAARLESEISNLRSQSEQMTLIYDVTREARNNQEQAENGRLGDTLEAKRQRLLQDLQEQLDQALAVYSEQNYQVRQLRAQIDQLTATLEAEPKPVAADAGDSTDADPPKEEGIDAARATLEIQLGDLKARMTDMNERKLDIEAQIENLGDTIGRTPANSIALEALTRDYENIQAQYNTAVDRLSRASTGERIEFLSRGQRITVVEPPSIPDTPTKPNRIKLAGAGTALGIACGLGLIVLLELMNRRPRRAEDIVAQFEVMPIASIPYMRTGRQQVVDRAIKAFFILIILVGVPAAVYAVHLYYLPLDLIAEKVMNRLGVRF